MLGNILVLVIAWLLCVSLTALSFANSDDAPPARSPSMPEVTASESASPSSMTADEERYIIGPGDVLDISVWKDESLTRSCVVRPDGFISFPLIGAVRATGRTASQLKSEMESKLIRYVPEVTLSVEIKQINSLVIYVIGKVNNPGRFILNVDVDVLQALATAGGLNVYAKRNKIKIFRQGAEETTIYPFEYDEVVEGKRMEENIHLRRGDVVVVP
jgi:polysaccharide export outer membrane protein